MAKIPLVSIITPCLNRAQFIEKAIRSVLNQNYSNIEHIIIDGGSTDGTLDILKKYPHLRVTIEKDQGVYDALNKGIKIAHGDIIGQLNSDDYYEEKIIEQVVHAFQKNQKIKAVVGSARIFVEEEGIERTLKVYRSVRSENLLFRVSIGTPIINAWFFSRSIFNKIGYYNISYKLAADKDILIKFSNANIPIKTINSIIYNYRYHEGSLTLNNDRGKRIERINECLKIAEFHKIHGYSHKIKHSMNEWIHYLKGDLLKTYVAMQNWENVFILIKWFVGNKPLWVFKSMVIQHYRYKKDISTYEKS